MINGITVFRSAFRLVNYTRNTQYTETDLSGDVNNDFASYTYTENYSASGVGVNARLGVIYRPNLNWRIGLAVHTPTFYSITDYLSAIHGNQYRRICRRTIRQSATLDNAAGASNRSGI